MNAADTVTWEAPLAGHWRRDFRLAEWLPGPISRSCETWLLPALDQGFSEASLAEYGSGTKPGYVVVNGWCFTTDPMPTKPIGLLVHSPVRMARIASAMARMGTRPEAVERWVAEPGLARYRSTDLPALRAAIDDADDRLAVASPTELVAIVDRLAVATGRLMLGMVQTMGFAGKAEYALARFFADHLRGHVVCQALDLTVGWAPTGPTPSHAVVSLDWYEPTAGERGTAAAPDDTVRVRLIEARQMAEAECRAVLVSDDRALARFDLLMSMLARWIPVREEMAAEFTLAWPTLRAALARIGDALIDRGILAETAGVFELSRTEIEAAVREGGSSLLQPTVDERRAIRREQASLTPPLSLGKPVRQWKQLDALSAVLRSDPPFGVRTIVTGFGSSPGTVTGVARIVRGPEDFDTFQPGEILVAPSTAPAWTPLLAIAAGAVTDGGGPFAHTSVVSREFGIPAIVTATGATTLIRTGDVITIDAASGTVSSSA